MVQTTYKQTDIGLIPSDWEVKQLFEISIIVDSLHQTPMFSKAGYAMVRVTDIKEGNLNLTNSLRVSEEIYNIFIKNYQPKYGDIVMSRVGSYGISSFVETTEQFCMGQNTVVIEPNISNRYLYYILSSPTIKMQVEYESFGTGYKSLSLKNIKELKIPLPPTLTEQTAIATALFDADALITSLEKLIAKKRNIKQGAMQTLLAPKKNWQEQTLKEVATYRRGSFPQPYGLDKWYDDINGFPFVQVYDVADNMILKSETKWRISKAAQAMSVFVPKGSIILTIQGSIGRIAITQYDSYVDRTLLIFESFQFPFDKYFFMLSVQQIFEYEKQNAPGGIIKTITKEALSSFKISFPPIEEQTQITSILKDIEAEIKTLETKLNKYKLLKQGMMQNLLTGKIRLIDNG